MRLNRNRRNSITKAVAIWLGLWICTQGLFIAVLPSVSTTQNASALYGLATLWVTLVVLIFCIARFGRSQNNRKVHKHALLPYIMPLAALAFLPTHYQSVLPIGLFIVMIIVTTLWQDLLTFGYLQGEIEADSTRSRAALVVAAMFFAGHAMFIPLAPDALQAAFQMPLIVAASAVLSASRLATRNVYLSNAIHLTYLLAFA